MNESRHVRVMTGEDGRDGGGEGAWRFRSHTTEAGVQAFCCMRSRASRGDRKNVSASRMRNHGVSTVKLQASLMSCSKGPSHGSHPPSGACFSPSAGLPHGYISSLPRQNYSKPWNVLQYDHISLGHFLGHTNPICSVSFHAMYARFLRAQLQCKYECEYECEYSYANVRCPCRQARLGMLQRHGGPRLTASEQRDFRPRGPSRARPSG